MKAPALLIALAMVLAGATGTPAQTYPTHPITVIVPYPAGGPTDTLARILSDHMKTTLGEPIIIRTSAARVAASALGASRARRRTAIRSASGTGTPTSCSARP
jgi:tripartite-type tricarboxylate transporter receptor subunit TctC